MSIEILRIRDVKRAVGMSVSTIYEWMANGKFPTPIRLGARSVGWKKDDIEAWQESRGVVSYRPRTSREPNNAAIQ